MQVRVLFFASLREFVGRDELCVEVPAPGSLEALLSALAAVLPEAALTALRGEGVRLAVNQEFVRPPLELEHDDEVAFMPPITGG